MFSSIKNNAGHTYIKFALLLIVLAVVVFWFSRPEKIIVDVINPTMGNVAEKVTNTRAGTITACKRAKLSLPIGGQIAQIHVKEGEQVEAQQLLLSLWHKDRAANLEQAQAIYHASKKHHQRSCIIADNLNIEATRKSHMLKQNLTSQEELDKAVANARAASANCAAMQAESDAKLAQVQTAKAHLEQTQLYAPFSGIVAEITGEVGEYTTPSPPGVATPPAIDLLTQDCHYISAPIDEVDAARLSVNLPVNIRLDAFSKEVFPGTLRRISPYVQDYEKQARTVTVEVDINEHHSPHFLAGYSADVEIIIAQKNDVLTLPTELIINNGYVYVLNTDNIIEQKAIQIGLSNWQVSEISSGLSQSDRVISSIGALGVKEGVRVEVSSTQ